MPRDGRVNANAAHAKRPSWANPKAEGTNRPEIPPYLPRTNLEEDV
jgi:hypothetical protein